MKNVFQKAIIPAAVYLAITISGSYAGASSRLDSYDAIRESGQITWGSDAEGGAPYVFVDPNDPNKTIGFEQDIAESLGRELGVSARRVQNGWESIIPALERGDFDIAMNGIEITPEKRQEVLFSVPYYIYSEQIVVRADEKHIKGLNDLRGKKVGTLGGAMTQIILQNLGGVDIKIYTTQIEPYNDLQIGRLDAVFMDVPIAVYYAKPNPKLRFCGEPVGEGFYGIAIRNGDVELTKKINDALKRMWDSGELQKIYERWGIWNETQKKLSVIMADKSAAPISLDESKKISLYHFLPQLLRGAGITIMISTSSMALAIALGLMLAMMRVYGGKIFSGVANTYVEIYRGTPLLIQLYILYYGLPNVGISLSPVTAAILGLGMNYAAYEAEIYRAGLKSVPIGQMEAAVSLGMTQGKALRRIILPQALRITLPPITNDFIALFKDSSLVSVIAMVELTKTYNMMASVTLRFFELGLIVAFLYFCMSFPLSVLARRLEESLKGEEEDD